MQGYSETQAPGGFQKVIFESVLDTYAGGVTMDSSAVAAAYTSSPGYLPAGTLISVPDPVTGLCRVIDMSAANTYTPALKPLGFVYADTKIDSNILVGVVTAGAVRKAALPQANVKTYITNPLTALPRIVIVE